MSYTTLQTQIGAELKILRKLHAMREHARLVSNANYNERLLIVANGYSTTDDEEARALVESVTHFHDEMAGAMQSAYQNYRSILESQNGLFGVIAAEIAASKEDIESVPIEYEHEESNNGEIRVIKRKGILGALYNDMKRVGQYVTANGVTNGGLVAASGNRGLLTLTAAPFLSHTPSGVVTFECTDDDVSQAEIKMSHAFNLPDVLADGEARLDAANVLAPEKHFEDGKIGANGVILTRTNLTAPTVTGDGFSLFSAITISGPKTGDCDVGKFYLKVRRDLADSWIINIYSDSARTNIVGQAGNIVGTTGTAVVAAFALLNGTTIGFTFSKVNAHTNLPNQGDEDTDIVFDIKTVRVGDKWTLALTNDYLGKFQTKIMQAWRISLPTSGSALWTDSLADSVSVT